MSAFSACIDKIRKARATAVYFERPVKLDTNLHPPIPTFRIAPTLTICLNFPQSQPQ